MPGENEITTGAQSPPWRVIGASVRGTAHEKAGLPCQDVHQAQFHPGGALLVALADGAGTASLSEHGARCAAGAVLQAISPALAMVLPVDEAGWEGLLRGAFQDAQAALQRLATETDVPLREYATTLTCAIAAGGWLAVGQLGDGAVVARRPDGEFFPVGRAQRGEYANETFFLSEEQALDRLAIHILRDSADALAVMSDGLTRLALKLPGYEPHAPFFQPLFAFAAACDDQKDAEQRLAAFLASERVCARTDDDKTLVLAVSQTGDQDFGLTDGKDPG